MNELHSGWPFLLHDNLGRKVQGHVCTVLSTDAVDESVREGWTTSDFRMKEIRPDTYLLTDTVHG